MKYLRVLMAVAAEPWAMLPYKLRAMLELLELQAGGVKFSREEIEARVTQKQEMEVRRAEGSVAVLPLRGVVANRMNMFADISGGMTCEGFARAFTAALQAPDIKAIVIDCDSPGGAVSGVDELSELIFNARGGGKLIVAHVNAQCASAAYWIATAADEVVATRSAEVGGVGVFTVHEDISQMLEKLGVTETLIRSGENKAEDLPFMPLSDDAKAYLQSRVDAFGGMFERRVAANRNVTLATVREQFGQGRVLGADDAAKVGMIDRVATLEDTLKRFGATQFTPLPKPRQARALAAERERRAIALQSS